MRLFKGEQQDTLEVNQPDNSWREARNWIFDKDALKNEDGFQQGELFTGFTQIGELLLPDNSILVFMVDSGGVNRIYKSPDGVTSATLVTNLAFGFDVRYPIRAKAKYTNELNIEVVFTDNYNPPRHITIDRSTDQIIETSLEETRLFPSISIPNFSLVSVDAGGFLDKGSYYITIAYNFGDDAYTNWVGMSNQIIVESGGQGFTITITDLDTKFESFKLGLVRVHDDTVVSAQETLVDYVVEGTSRTITVIGNGTDIAIDGIALKAISYDRIGDFAVLDNRLYIADLYRDATLDYQEYANAIRIEPIYDDFIALDTDKDSYADPLIVFDKVGFPDDEIMAFYIRLHLLDGTSGGDFFIPSQGYNLMEIHTNTNEDYPSGKGYPSGQVRHHKFPRKSAADFLTGTTGIDADSVVVSGAESQATITADALYGVAFANSTGTLGTTGADPNDSALTDNTVTFSEALTVTLDFNYTLSATTTTAGSEDVTLVFEVLHNGSELYSNDYNITGDTTYNMTDDVLFDITVAPNDTISFRGLIYINTGTSSVLGTQVVDWKISIKGVYPSSDANYFHKPTAIKVSNVVIPSDIASKIQGYEIMYAARNGTNSRVLGQSIVYPYNWRGTYTLAEGGKTRFHAFDILLNKPRIYPTGIRGQFILDETNSPESSKYDVLGTPTADTYNSDIVQAKYTPGNNLAAANEQGEEHYTFLVSTAKSLTTGDRLLANLVAEKTDYYLGFENQVLQSTGIVHKISGAGTYTVDKIYGGDTYTCLYDVRLTRKRNEGSTDTEIRSVKIPCSSRYNISLREWGDDWWEQPEVIAPPYEQYAIYEVDDTTLSGLTPAEKALAKADATKQYSNYLDYDEGFNFGNKFIQTKIQGDTIQELYFRVARSPEQNLETKTSSWRTFLLNDYYELNRDRGVINNLEVIDSDRLIIHHERGLFVTMPKERLEASTVEIVVGAGDLFNFAPKETIHTTHGFLGSIHKFANFVCPLGYVFISNGEIYSLTSKSLKNLTVGMSKFYRDNIDTGDNPYNADKQNQYYTGGISMAWDERYDRLLLMVNEFSSSYTKSYSRDLEAWVCSHDYADGKLFDTGQKVYSFYNSRIYIHNSTNKCTYYDGITYNSTISIIGNKDASFDKLFDNVNWKLTGLDSDRNFSTIGVSSPLDNIGTVTIVPYTGLYDTSNTRKLHSTWYFNHLTVDDDELGKGHAVTGLYAKIDLTLDNSPQDEVSIIDIDYEYEKIIEEP